MAFLMEAEADGTIRELVNERVRMRMEELCRTESRYREISKALAEAGLSVRDGKVFYGSQALDQVLASKVGS